MNYVSAEPGVRASPALLIFGFLPVARASHESRDTFRSIDIRHSALQACLFDSIRAFRSIRSRSIIAFGNSTHPSWTRPRRPFNPRLLHWFSTWTTPTVIRRLVTANQLLLHYSSSETRSSQRLDVDGNERRARRAKHTGREPRYGGDLRPRVKRRMISPVRSSWAILLQQRRARL